MGDAKEIEQSRLVVPGGVLAEALPHGIRELPSPLSVLTATLTGVSSAWSGYLTAGWGLTLVTLPISIVAIIAAGLAVWSGLVLAGDGGYEGLASVGLIGGMMMAIGIVLVSVAVVAGPLNASLYRAVQAHIEEGTPLTIGAAFSSVTTDVGKVLGVLALQFVVTVIAAGFCYFPVFIASAALHLAFPAVVLNRLGPTDAIRGSIARFRAHPAHHFKSWGLGFLMLVVVANIPLVGSLFAMPLYAAYQVRYFKETGEWR